MPHGFPKITEGPTKQSVEKGRTATLTCRAQGTPPINIIWIKDMLPVLPSDRIEFTGPGGGKFNHTPPDLSSNQQIYSITGELFISSRSISKISLKNA